MPVLDKGAWDLVLLDIRTPRVNGLEVFSQIVKRRPELIKKIIVTSGSIADRQVQELLSKHPVPCLPKPYALEDFNHLVRQLLKGPDHG